jgi:nitroreductase
MELMEVLRNRRAVRDYTSATLSRTLIERLIEAAVLAPSAMNVQPWAFTALLDPERIDGYEERARRWFLESPEGSNEEARSILRKPGFRIFRHAPALVLVMARSSAAQANDDCCLAAQNLMLAARDQGIGSCWIGFSRRWLNLPSTKKDFGLPEDYQVVAPVILGYPKAWPEFQGRRPPEIHWL